MNCRGWNPLIALYVEGDLEKDAAAHLEQHLSVCDACSAFASELRETQRVFRDMSRETIEMESLQRVRARVLEQVRRFEQGQSWLDRAGAWLWGGARRYATLGCAALVLLAVGFWLRPSPAPPQQTSEFHVPAAPKLIPPAASAEVRATTPVRKSQSRSILSRAEKAPAQVDTPELAPELVAQAAEALQPESFPAEAEAGPGETLVQIVTDDPDVVIYWLLDSDGGF